MKKTVSVNIKGTNFLIEEDAYELLQDYLKRLAVALKNEEGSQEILEDVELRIAEICSAKLSETKTVIELKDIEDILVALGDPSDFLDEDEVASSSVDNTESSRENIKTNKRLFRDGDSSYVGGVCAGLGNYFGIDALIVRLIFFVFILSGIGITIYIILWIVVPKAESTIDKLRMKGQPITVESVKNEVNSAAENIKSGANSFKNKITGDPVNKERAARGKRAITTLLGLGFFGFGIMNLIGFLVFILGGFHFIPIHGDSGFLSITSYGELVLSSAGDVQLAWIGGLLLWISSVIFLFVMGTLLLFKIKSKWTKFIIGGLGLFAISGIVICIVIGMRTGRDFAFDREIDRFVGSSDQKELVIVPRTKNYKKGANYHVRRHGHFTDLEIEKDRIKSFGIEVIYVPSNDTSFHIIQNLSSSGNSGNSALQRSKNIYHDMELINDTLYVDVEYSFPKKDKLRDQEVKIIIQIPEGSSVRLDNRTIHLGSKNNSGNSEHPYYKKQGQIRGDGYYDHYFDNRRSHHFKREIERELEEETLEEFDLK